MSPWHLGKKKENQGAHLRKSVFSTVNCEIVTDRQTEGQTSYFYYIRIHNKTYPIAAETFIRLLANEDFLLGLLTPPRDDLENYENYF